VLPVKFSLQAINFVARFLQKGYWSAKTPDVARGMKSVD